MRSGSELVTPSGPGNPGAVHCGGRAVGGRWVRRPSLLNMHARRLGAEQVLLVGVDERGHASQPLLAHQRRL